MTIAIVLGIVLAVLLVAHGWYVYHHVPTPNTPEEQRDYQFMKELARLERRDPAAAMRLAEDYEKNAAAEYAALRERVPRDVAAAAAFYRRAMEEIDGLQALLKDLERGRRKRVPPDQAVVNIRQRVELLQRERDWCAQYLPGN